MLPQKKLLPTALTSSETRASNFIGRQQGMASLIADSDDTLPGWGQVVKLARGPEIGKSRTAQELVSLAESLGIWRHA